jgi:putative addiction module killer protein
LIEPVEVLLYRRRDKSPFLLWLDSLKDRQAVAAIRSRINRLRLGLFGDCKSVGDGVDEMRINLGPGYRVYFGRQGRAIVILLCGGSKRTQSKDISLAISYWKEYLDAQNK